MTLLPPRLDRPLSEIYLVTSEFVCQARPIYRERMHCCLIKTFQKGCGLGYDQSFSGEFDVSVFFH